MLLPVAVAAGLGYLLYKELTGSGPKLTKVPGPLKAFMTPGQAATQSAILAAQNVAKAQTSKASSQAVATAAVQAAQQAALAIAKQQDNARLAAQQTQQAVVAAANTAAAAMASTPQVQPFIPTLNASAPKATGTVALSKSPAGWTLPVKTVQQYFIKLNFMSVKQANGKPSDDGVRGQTTDLTVRAWQNQHSLPVTGVVDSDTANSIQSAVAGLSTPSSGDV